MFTGLIEELGTMKKINQKGNTLVLVIEADKIMSDLHLGDSIAVNGVCLTVTKFTKKQFEADVMPETFKHTSLSTLKEGSKVNLERAMAANGRFGGHFVTGHIDGTGTIRKRTHIENAILIEIEIPEEFSHFVLEKGSIAIDGTSLTIFKTTNHSVTISLIPHTAKEAVIGLKREGEIVNLEFDVMAKYFYSFMQKRDEVSQPGGITTNFLKENGFY
ncbi:riboflavin synthase [Niallia sp. XMNu-256]|uniref:riboflavin synthase n=1 Tax=Niallia sp. XMNu-256 TaxID=3082444 RepID=UPI0030CFB242